MIAGLEKIDEGEIFINDQKINELHPSKRQTAMVFQSYALYPHMNVYENMSFGLKIEKRPKEEINTKVMQAAKILKIEELLERKPKKDQFKLPSIIKIMFQNFSEFYCHLVVNNSTFL